MGTPPPSHLPTPDAADPDRMTLRHGSLNPGAAALGVDALGTTYQVSGCGRSMVLVCANPTNPPK
jgi:hypothetical protein